jgi:hypothetical protein
MAVQGTPRQAGDGEVVSPVKARAGFLDRPVLTVLVVSTALVCIAFAALYFYYLR